MLSDREKLINLLYNFEPSPKLLSQLNDHGIEKIYERLSRRYQLRPHATSPHTRVITFLDKAWPAQLHDLLDEMPLTLWIAGNFDLKNISRHCITITGPKQPKLSTIKQLGRVACHAARFSAVIASDLSAESNSLLLQLALRNDAVTVGVLAGGIDQPFPATSRGLHCAIKKSGLLVTEYPPGVIPSRTTLLRRNRILAALSTLVIALDPKTPSTTSSILNWANLMNRKIVEV